MKQENKQLALLIALIGFSVLNAKSQIVQPVDTSLYGPISTIQLNADGVAGEETYTLIRNAFGSSSLEVPDLYVGNHQDFVHIQEGTDDKIGPYFIFFLHRDLDWDRDKYPSVTDRQRNEIKIYDGSVEQGKAREGDLFRYRWKVFIGESMTISKNFCHLFQLKAVKGDDSHPILTFSGSVNSGTPEVELLHSPSKDDTQLVKNNWENATGQWLNAECIALIADDGYLKFSLATQTGDIVIETEQSNIDMWREGASYVRPKWGIYRSLGSKEMILNETDSVKTAKHSIEKLVLKSEITDIEYQPKENDPIFYFSAGNLIVKNVPEGQFKIEIIDLSGRIIYVTRGENYLSDNIQIETNLLNNKSGLMFIRLTSKNKIFTTKINSNL